MANMIAAFFEHTEESSVFDNLYIAGYPEYKEQVGQHNVIFIDFSELPRECHSYREYIARIQDGLTRDMKAAYPQLDVEDNAAIWDILSLVFVSQ